MNNSFTKLKDFELDEISGGVTAKQVGKKVAAYAIKGACAIIPACLVLGTEFSFFEKKANDLELSGFRYTPKKITISELFGVAFMSGAIFGIPTTATCIGGLKLGEWICKKLNLED